MIPLLAMVGLTGEMIFYFKTRQQKSKASSVNGISATLLLARVFCSIIVIVPMTYTRTFQVVGGRSDLAQIHFYRTERYQTALNSGLCALSFSLPLQGLLLLLLLGHPGRQETSASPPSRTRRWSFLQQRWL